MPTASAAFFSFCNAISGCPPWSLVLGIAQVEIRGRSGGITHRGTFEESFHRSLGVQKLLFGVAQGLVEEETPGLLGQNPS